MLIENYLRRGHKSAVSRQELCSMTLCSDRENRRLIAEAVEKRKVPIINIGNGYFIYDGTEEDDAELNAYYRKENARAKSIFRKLSTIRNAVNYDRNQQELEV